MDDKIAQVDVDDKTVEDFIYGNAISRSSKFPNKAGNRSQRYSPNEFLEVPSSAGLPTGINWRKEGLFHGQESYSSLGEKGTTASISAYGSILQISQYLDAGTSGIYCADPCISEPWFLRQRMKELLKLSTDPAGGFGLCLDPQLANSKPQLQFLHSRWPRYTHSIGDLSVSIQYFANRGSVIQQYLFEKVQKSDAHTSRCADDGDVNQTTHECYATGTQTDSSPAQENQIHDAREQTQHSSEDLPQEDQAEQNQTQENLFLQNETKLIETIGITQKRNSVRDYLILKPRLQIRESEWADSRNKFNMDYPDDASYDTFTGQNQYSLVVRHQCPYADEAVALVIAAFVNGHPTKIAKAQDNSSGMYEINLDSNDVREFEQGRDTESDTSLEITVAYRLQLMAKGYSWESTLIPVSVLDFTDLMAQSSMAQNPDQQTYSLSTSTHLDFIMKRNLEHILSVCSIPVPAAPIRKDGSAEIDVLETSAEEPRAKVGEPAGRAPIALTCGDISGHHVVVSASFFAFQFLLAIYSHIEGKYYVKLEERILETLTGHLEWIFLRIEKDPDDGGQFLARNWANGKKLKSILEDRNTQHTSLQVIKAKDFASKLQKSGKPLAERLSEKIDGFIENWISSLRNSDSRDYCVFPRATYWGVEEGYYLRDHVLVWKALGITEVLDSLQDAQRYRDERDKRKLSLGVYTSDEARRRILKRFTTQNSETKERMFAIYRDPQNNSFLLDSEDTVLFYDEEQFFADPMQGATNPQPHDGGETVSDKWDRTLNFQTHHEGANGKDWREPLQYALAIQMGKKGHQIDSRLPSDIFAEGLKMLLQSCSASGIFPGLLTREAQLSGVFGEDADVRWSEQDSYWHQSFELPYFLWKCAKKRLEETSGQDKKQAPLEESARAYQSNTNKRPASQKNQRIHNKGLIRKLTKAETVFSNQHLTNQKNVFEVSDEWLVRCPEFLHFDPQISYNDVPKVSTQEQASISELQPLVIDIPKRRDQTDDQTLVDPQPRTSEVFFQRLHQWRTKRTGMLIKKRIIWLSSSDEKAAEPFCSATVPESESFALASFFGRHRNRDKHFLDGISVSSNTWKTEFQLSFYQLHDLNEEHGDRSTPEIDLVKRIRQGSMGFRFNGDFFDCYWTCHVIKSGNAQDRREWSEAAEHEETEDSETEPETFLDHRLSTKTGSIPLAAHENGPKKKRAWHQRKVLELILFEEIIREVTAGTKDILTEINKMLAPIQTKLEDFDATKELPNRFTQAVLFARFDGNAYSSFSAQWEMLQQLLKVLDEDLDDTFKHITSWQSREEDRGYERPRWTRKDEKRYRRAITKMQISNAECVRELQQLKEKAQSLRDSLISTREYIRDELNFSVARLTRSFTYITLVFLPLGTAMGLFSMSETPTWSNRRGVVITYMPILFIIIFAAKYFIEPFGEFKKIGATLAGPLRRARRKLKGEAQKTEHRVPDKRHSRDPLPEADTQEQRARRRRQASPPGDLENQSGPRHSFG